MSQSTSRGARVVGDYIVGRQIGSGSFSVVWHARHRVHGMEVAIKEIVMDRLSKKLQDSLLQEISILKEINHPNIIQLHDIIEVPGRIHLVLEYCRGGDLSLYIQRHGRVPETAAKHFMHQLAAGLLLLRHHTVIHRDLKPQNLLLSSSDDQAVLKIADFGFARSLQPRGLAETLCGSPLYMAPEIMQLQKYDAKADLWSVGTILFQLVTGNTPFTGNNQIQLLQNIVRSNELRFPPDIKDLSFDCIDLCQKLLRRNPVERLTFDEFFNHPFLSQNQPQELLRNTITSRYRDSSAESSRRYNEERSQDDCLPFLLDDDPSGLDGNPAFPTKRPSMKSSYGFSLDRKIDKKTAASNDSTNMEIGSRHSTVPHKVERTSYRLSHHGSLDINSKEAKSVLDQRSAKNPSRVVDSLEFIDQDYVLVSGPPLDVSSSSVNASRPHNSSCKSDSTSAGSMDVGDVLEQPSTHSWTRIRSLQQCASAIKELVHEKVVANRQLEAFSIQLVILAIWKQALHICHTQAASAIEGSPTQEMTRFRRSNSKRVSSPDVQGSQNSDTQGPEAVCSQIEREFHVEVGHADELARGLDPDDAPMPDAMEAIYQSALAFGRRGAVEELMGDMDSAVSFYSKAVRLFIFLLVEAPSLIINPPFSLTNSDRYRLRTIIDALNSRQSQSRPQRMALFKCEDQQCPP